MIEIRTIEHTGTNFLEKLIRDHGLQTRTKHFNDEWLSGLVVSTIRKPEYTWITWQSRGRGNYDRFRSQWLRMDYQVKQNLNHFVLPIDTPNRNHYLEDLSKILGVTLRTDWTPIASHPHKARIEALDFRELYAIDTVKKYYGVLSS